MAMSILDGFVLNILKSISFSKKEEEAGQMSIIVQRPYDYLVRDLQKVFKGQEEVKVKVDSRYGQRRTKKEPVSYEHRQAERRRKKETLVEVVIST